MSKTKTYLSCLLVILVPLSTGAVEDAAKAAQEASVEEKIGGRVDMNLPFNDRFGKQVLLKDLIVSNRPLLLLPLYYNCPRICGITLRGTADLLNTESLKLGEDFTVATFSFDQTETKEDAERRASESYDRLKDRASGENGWHFLTASSQTIEEVTRSIGFHFQEESGEFVHSAVFVILTSEGVISRYFYGVTFDPENVRYALIEASEGKVGSAFDKVFLYCFHFDPTKGRYTMLVWNIARIISAVIAVVVLTVILALRLRERRPSTLS